MVRNADGSKMSSRKGTALTGVGLLDTVKEAIYVILAKNKSNYSKEEQESIAEAATIAAVKYSLLRVSLPSDIAFDVAKSVSFDGDSGPYLLYTYARCTSLARKATVTRSLVHPGPLNPEEHALVRLLFHVSDVVAEATDRLAPSVLCGYVNDLAQAFNLLYAKHEIASSPFRLAVAEATGATLAYMLTLLGIPTVERM
jgi:arginyl-tRNA synthetase